MYWQRLLRQKKEASKSAKENKGKQNGKKKGMKWRFQRGNVVMERVCLDEAILNDVSLSVETMHFITVETELKAKWRRESSAFRWLGAARYKARMI